MIMNKVIQKSILLWGLIDLFYVVWIVFSAIQIGNVPFYSDFIENLNVAISFGEYYPVAMVVVTYSMQVTIVISALFMLLSKKIGVYISLIQAPFRIFLVLPFTFFFIVSIKKYVPFSMLYLVVFVYFLEFFKIYTQVGFLKIKKNYIYNNQENVGHT